MSYPFLSSCVKLKFDLNSDPEMHPHKFWWDFWWWVLPNSLKASTITIFQFKSLQHIHYIHNTTIPQLKFDTLHFPKCHTHSTYPQHQKLVFHFLKRKEFKCTQKGGTFNVIQQPISKRNLLFVAVAFGSPHTSRSLWFVRSGIRPACEVRFLVAKGEEGRGCGAIVGEDKEARHRCHNFVTTPLAQQAFSLHTRETITKCPFSHCLPRFSVLYAVWRGTSVHEMKWNGMEIVFIKRPGSQSGSFSWSDPWI